VGEPPIFRICDMPGYGYAKAPIKTVQKWRYLVNDYLRGRQVLKRTFLLIDSRHGVKEVDREIMKMLDGAAVSYRVVLTKTDKIKASELAAVEEATLAELRKHSAAFPLINATSAEKKGGIEALREAVLEAVVS
jgi:GTP-binding protein